MNNNLLLTKALAALLITNSHFDSLYPMPYLAGGGALGNSLFFFLSGFGICASALARRIGFFEYSYRRLSRIYPSVWVVVLVGMFFGIWAAPNDILGVLNIFIWPTPYWFISAIVIFYGMVYWILSVSVMTVVRVICVVVVVYAWFYTGLDHQKFSIEEGYFKWIFYFIVMLFGVLQAKTNIINIRWPVVSAIVAAVLYYLTKVMVFRFGFGSLQFLCSLIEVYFVICVYCADRNFEWNINSRIQKIIFSVVTAISLVTLEIYLVQVPLLSNNRGFGLVLPLNIVLMFACIIFLAHFLRGIERLLRRIFLFVIPRANGGRV